jgi:hypothetical protein
LSSSELDKSAQDVAAEGAILSEMLEIVSKRAALRPSDYPGSGSSLQLSENVSLPVLPPQTTINPLLQYNSSLLSQSTSNGAHSRYQPTYSSSRPSITHHTFSSQSHNQEHDVSHDDANSFLFDGTEHIYLRTNLSMLHDCEVLLEQYENQFAQRSTPINDCVWPRFNAHTVLVIIEFFILYIAILWYSYSQMRG